jgi:DDE superfamily endonuclease
MKTTTTARLTRFRDRLYHEGLGMRRDALFDLVDALLTSSAPQPLVRLSLAPCFARGWASTCDALADGRLDEGALRRLCVDALPPPSAGTRELWAVDGTTWPRPAAKTSPARTFCRFITGGQPQEGIVPGWEYQVLGMVPEAQGSWVLPLDVARRDPATGTPTALAITQFARCLAARRPDAPRPVGVLDSHYRVAELIGAGLACDFLVRLATNRRLFRRPPPPAAGRGAPRKHGPKFKLDDPTTHGVPDRTQVVDDPIRGTVTLDAWVDLHDQSAAACPFTVVRIQPERLPRRVGPPAPLWLAWTGAELPADLSELWHAYERRFAEEHLFRFVKQDLGWTTVRVRDPRAADRWTWLVVAVVWQLWLARELVADQTLPWERPAAPVRLSPGRVRRAFPAFLTGLVSHSRDPQPRGKSPGRRVGERPGPRERYPVVRRAPPLPA